MKRKGKKLKIILLCIAAFFVLCILLVVYKRISIFGVDRGACHKSVAEVKLNEFLAGNIKPKKIDYYITGQTKKWNERKQVYDFYDGEKTGVLRLRYSKGSLMGVPVKEYWYTFNEETQKCRQVTYRIDIQYKDKFLKTVKKKFGESFDLKNVLIEREDYVLSVGTVTLDYFLVKTEFK